MNMELVYTSLALFATIFFLYNVIIKLSNSKNKKLPPSPPSIPILGHIHLLKPPFHRTLQSLAQRYGPIFSLKLGCQRVLVVSSPWAAEECLAQNDIIFANRPKFLIGELLGYNYSLLIWCPYGEYWRNLRRVTTITMLSLKRINEAGPTRKVEIRNMILELQQSSKGGTHKVIMNEMFGKLARNFVMRIVSGKPWEEMIIKPPSSLMTICDFFPFLRWVGFKGIEKEMIKRKVERDEFLQRLIDECREKRRKGTCCDVGSETTPMIQHLLLVQEVEPEYYTDEVLKGIILVMLLAGSETTARTLEWAMSNLLNHPEILAKARKQIDTHVGKGRLVDESDLRNLSYIHCIINETLRLFPPAPLLIPHCSSQDCTIGGYHVPKGTVLFLNAWAIHTDPNLWDEPTRFKPERFEKERELGFKYMPFGIGRRSCPGNNVALRNISLTLAILIQCFDWEAIDGELVDLTETCEARNVIVPKDKPLEAICRPRSSMEMSLFV